jgi:hypothetical protein
MNQAQRPPRIGKMVRLCNARNRTGCVGVSFFQAKNSGLMRSFFSAFTRREDGSALIPKFCIETLGKEEAFRRAVQARAEYEARIGRAAIAAKLQSNHQPLATFIPMDSTIFDAQGRGQSTTTITVYGEGFLFGQIDIKVPGYITVSKAGKYLQVRDGEANYYVVSHAGHTHWRLVPVLSQKGDDLTCDFDKARLVEKGPLPED